VQETIQKKFKRGIKTKPAGLWRYYQAYRRNEKNSDVERK
jgi:hypothetical protein